MPEANNQNKAAAGKKSQSAASRWPDISGIPTTPVAPSGGPPAIATDEEEAIAGIPTTPIAPTGSRPVAPLPSYPVFTFPFRISRFSRNFRRPACRSLLITARSVS